MVYPEPHPPPQPPPVAQQASIPVSAAPPAAPPPRAAPAPAPAPYEPPDLSAASSHPLDSHSTRFLLITFVIIFLMAVTGLILSALFETDDSIFRDAIRIIGIGGPASTGASAASDAIGKWRSTPTPPPGVQK